jgi:hypothetical protein
MKTIEPKGEESKSQKQEPAAEQETTPADDFPDPNFTIEATGGPSDGSGGSHTGPPPRG